MIHTSDPFLDIRFTNFYHIYQDNLLLMGDFVEAC